MIRLLVVIILIVVLVKLCKAESTVQLPQNQIESLKQNSKQSILSFAHIITDTKIHQITIKEHSKSFYHKAIDKTKTFISSSYHKTINKTTTTLSTLYHKAIDKTKQYTKSCIQYTIDKLQLAFNHSNKSQS